MKIVLFIVTIMCFVGACSSEERDQESELNSLQEKIRELDSENRKLHDKVAQLEKELKQSKGATLELPLITYTTYSYSSRFVPKETEVLWFPLENSPKVTFIPRNSIVNVLDAGLSETEGRELWLYVEAPVYDTPMNFKGWIREKDTVEYTKENQKDVQSDVIVKKGISFYEGCTFESIASTQPKELPYDTIGRIIKKRDGYVELECSGGWYFWVEEKYIEYPSTK